MASSIVKRQRQRKRIDTDGDPEFQVAPMVDVLLVLMLFFMAITSTEILKKDPALKLADARHAKRPDAKDQKNEITVNVRWDNKNSVAQFSYDGLNYAAAADLQGVLAAAHRQNPNAFIVIRADKNTEYSNIADLMGVCANAGIATVTFAVLIGGNQAPEDSGASTPQ